MVLFRTIAKNLFGVSLVFLLLFSCFLLTSNTEANPLGPDMSWDEFLSDYYDKDGDGENDTFLSLDVPGRITINDRVISIEDFDSLKFSVIVMESNPEPLIFGNTLEDSIKPGDIVLVEIYIIEGEEADGDRCEAYDIISISYFAEIDNGNGDSGGGKAEQHMPWYGWFLVAGPFLIGCLILYLIYIAPKRKKKALELKIAEKTKESNQTYYCSGCNEPLKYRKKQGDWYCRHCKESHTGLASTSYDFGTIREQY